MRSIGELQKKIEHRGPDDFGNWSNDHVALGHLRLSIIDLSEGGHQPMIDPQTGCVLVFNGEIYNYKELKQALAGKYDFRTQSDTEVLLASYVVYGKSFITRLRGMFALALYDPRTRETWLVRDRLGIKPLYYRKLHDVFYFASEIKALVKSPLPKPSLDTRKVHEFLVARQLDTDDHTLYEGVMQLKQGHYMRVGEQGNILEYDAYWHLPSLETTRPFELKHRQELVEQMDVILQLHMRSDVPIGAFVSGGLDSSSVACFALRHGNERPLHTYSAVLPTANAENELIPNITSLPGIVPHHFLLDGKDFFDDIKRVMYFHDEPLLDGSMYAHFKLCEMAREDGVKVLLSGAGGDEVFGGYLTHVSSYLGSLLQQFQWKLAISEIQKIASQSEYSTSNLVQKTIQEVLPKTLVRYLKNRTFRSEYRHVRGDIEIKHFYHHNSNAWIANVYNNYMSWTVPPYLHYEDRNSMAFGVEVRVPFYDHLFLEWVMQFDPRSLMKGRSKSIMRDSFRGIVPDPILDQRGKYGFPSPIDELLRVSKESKRLYFDLVPSNPYFNRIESDVLGKHFFSTGKNLGAFWRNLSFALWYRECYESA